MTIDRTSFEILWHLANDARISNKQLAAAVGLAPSTAHERLRQLRTDGIYQGAHAEVDLRRLGLAIEAILHIELARQVPKGVRSFLDKLKSIAEVRQFMIVTGKFDIVAQVAVRDTDHLRRLEYDLTAFSIVERIETAVVFESWRQFALPMPAWLRPAADVAHKRRATRRKAVQPK